LPVARLGRIALKLVSRLRQEKHGRHVESEKGLFDCLWPENAGVGGSTRSLATTLSTSYIESPKRFQPSFSPSFWAVCSVDYLVARSQNGFEHFSCAAILSSLTLCAYSWSVVFLPGRFWLSEGSTGSLGFPNAGSRVLHASILYLPVVFGTMMAWKA
jgi:hypothetical protein